MNFSKNKTLRTGFTLVELLIVTVIIVLLASTVLVNHREGSSNFAQTRVIQSIAQAIRTAQNRSLSSDCSSPPCRFGVNFELAKDKVLVFDDVDLDGQYDSGEEVEEIKFEEDIILTNISPNPYTCGLELCIDILFDPPNPITILKTTDPADQQITITITGGKTITVISGAFGEGGSIDIN